jgi:hypothetical protein
MIGKVRPRGGRVLDLWFEVALTTELHTITPGSVVPVVEDDKEIDRETASATSEKVILTTEITQSNGGGAIEFAFASSDEATATVDVKGEVTPLKAGSVVITITATQGSLETVRNIPLTFTVGGAGVVETITGGVSGSAREALTDTFDASMISAGGNPGAKEMFTVQNHASGTYIRNTGSLLSGTHALKFTCISPYNSRGANTRAGTAITRRHIVFASHYPLTAGDSIRFVESSTPSGETYHDKTILHTLNILQDGKQTDVSLAVLDSDLPVEIKPCKIFPSDFADYLPAGQETLEASRIPLVALDQQEKILCLDMFKPSLVPSTNKAIQSVARRPQLSHREAYFENIVSGDSGNPLFAVLPGDLCLVTMFWGPSGGCAFWNLVAELNAGIVSLDANAGDSTGYTVTEADFSAYTNYNP